MRAKASLLILLPCLSAPAFAWGCKGHQIVALTAWGMMSDNAKKMTEQLQAAFPPDPSLKHFCTGDEMLPTIAKVATWADDYRSVDRSTADWHFLDVPLGTPVGDGTGFCAMGCVTNAVRDQYAILQNAPGASTADNAAALRFVIHFLGDMHQPLHIATNNDRGGNCVPVKYVNTNPRLDRGKFTPELHSVWDDNLVDAAMQAANKSDVSSFANFLADLATQNQADWSKGSAPDWMAVTHSIAETVGYGELQATPPIPNLASAIAGPPTLQSCRDGHYDKTLFGKHLAVTSAYVSDATPQVRDQLAKAGLRLANMLNALWP